MKSLQDASERICELKGSLMAIDALLPALLEALPVASHGHLVRSFEAHAEATRTVMQHAPLFDQVLSTFEREIARMRAVLAGTAPAAPRTATEAALLTTTRVSTFQGPCSLSGASGFFFRRDGRLFLVTSRHVLADETSSHYPDRIEIEVHTDKLNLTRYAAVSVPLYRGGLSQWRQAADTAGDVDVAAIEIDVSSLPAPSILHAFGPEHLEPSGDVAEVGDALVIVGFPLGFHDTVHHLPVVRSASIASAFGVRFQQQGYFLTDARTHRGSSGAPVLRRIHHPNADRSQLPWQLLGVHSTRMDMRTRDLVQDESLGLNCAWYADVLMALTEPSKATMPA
ncbi:serine protease [Variovorax sp. WS11]|uniref:S1 family peptidase n=1 Tax=Variovorax sp. WS11 TaxID=1105204 RepID=UPI000D0CEE67|nr:serine protease [Variovorax sp. WS11]NDZ16331.1 trypsin-like peptidase domain-containing protein [Variovorax sp. WS11]PSL81772.1 serine protease [Variovorax sp. WS11]